MIDPSGSFLNDNKITKSSSMKNTEQNLTRIECVHKVTLQSVSLASWQ